MMKLWDLGWQILEFSLPTTTERWADYLKRRQTILEMRIETLSFTFWDGLNLGGGKATTAMATMEKSIYNTA